jgi:hypothetical protein
MGCSRFSRKSDSSDGGKSLAKKGPGFEREVCAILSQWWTNGERDDVFTRTSGSGGRFTARWKRGKKTAYQGGDMTASDPIGEPFIRCFNIEMKTGYGDRRKTKYGVRSTNWCVLDILDGSKTKEGEIIENMWDQCEADARKTNRTPILIFRRKQKRICIMFTQSLHDIIRNYYGDPFFSFIRIFIKSKSSSVSNLFVTSLTDFMIWAPNIRPFLPILRHATTPKRLPRRRKPDGNQENQNQKLPKS